MRYFHVSKEKSSVKHIILKLQAEYKELDKKVKLNEFRYFTFDNCFLIFWRIIKE